METGSYSGISRVFLGQLVQQTSNPWRPHQDWQQVGNFFKFVPPDPLKMLLLALFFLRFFVNPFFNSLLQKSYIQVKSLYGHKLVRAAVLSCDLSWKDATSSTEGTTCSSVNYLSHLINKSTLTKNSRKKVNSCVIYLLCI